MKVRIVAKTDIGKKRDRNEDGFTFCTDLCALNWDKEPAETELGPKGALLVVVDGMGGTNAGDVASSLAIESLQKTFNSSDLNTIVSSEEQIKGFLQKTVTKADQYINDYMLSHPETSGMGTTIVICWILDDHAYMAWCGDSRGYVFNRSTGLKALTKDHSYVQELIDKGELTEEEALTHPDSNLITRGLGAFDTPAIADIVVHPIQPNEMFLLCSDGLCGYCNNSTIERIVKTYGHNLDECCDKLIELALNAGGFDNICVAMAAVGDLTPTQKPKRKRLFSRLFFGK